jgi:hypothetical protein
MGRERTASTCIHQSPGFLRHSSPRSRTGGLTVPSRGLIHLPPLRCVGVISFLFLDACCMKFAWWWILPKERFRTIAYFLVFCSWFSNSKHGGQNGKVRFLRVQCVPWPRHEVCAQGRPASSLRILQGKESLLAALEAFQAHVDPGMAPPSQEGPG